MGSSNGTAAIIIFLTLLFLIILFLANSWWPKRKIRRYDGCNHGGDCKKKGICIKNYVQPRIEVEAEAKGGGALIRPGDNRILIKACACGRSGCDGRCGRGGPLWGCGCGRTGCDGRCGYGIGCSCGRAGCNGRCGARGRCGCGRSGCDGRCGLRNRRHSCTCGRVPCLCNGGRAGDVCFGEFDCFPGLACLGGVCTPIRTEPGTTCTVDTDCPAILTAWGQSETQKCVGGLCTKFCNCDAQCKDGRKCVQGVCNPPPGASCSLVPNQGGLDLCLGVPCTKDEQCIGSLVCSTGRFGTDNKVCSIPVNGVLGQGLSCSQNSDCQQGLRCIFGTCLAEGLQAGLLGQKEPGTSGAPCNPINANECQSEECDTEDFWLYRLTNFQNGESFYSRGPKVLSRQELGGIIDINVSSENAVRFLAMNGTNTFSVVDATNLASNTTEYTLQDVVVPSGFGGERFELLPELSVLADTGGDTADIFYVVYANNTPPSGTDQGVSRFLIARVLANSAGSGVVITPTPIGSVIEFFTNPGELNYLSVSSNRNGAAPITRVLLGFVGGSSPTVYFFPDLTRAFTGGGERINTVEIADATNPRFIANGTSFAYISTANGTPAVAIQTTAGGTAAGNSKDVITLDTTVAPGETIVDYAIDAVNSDRGLLITDRRNIYAFIDGFGGAQQDLNLQVIFINDIALVDAAGADVFVVANACR